MGANILLESGTNELEILEFKIAGNSYGINVAKVREILGYIPATPIPNSNECIEGIIMPRNEVLTIINLSAYLHLNKGKYPDNSLYIVTNFNKLNVAFHVDSVVGIKRMSWEEIILPDENFNNGAMDIATGVIKYDNRIVIVLDFEKIMADIAPDTAVSKLEIPDRIKDEVAEMRGQIGVYIAEDSLLLRNLIKECLNKAGYTKMEVFSDGKQLWDKLCEDKENGTVDDNVNCVITDIEMPVMDGHRLVKLIKDDIELKKLPTIIFSSLINDEMKRKGAKLGADFQISKPEIGQLVDGMDMLLGID